MPPHDIVLVSPGTLPKTSSGKLQRSLCRQRFLQGARGSQELAGCGQSCVSVTPDTMHLLFNNAPYRVRLYNSPLLQKFLNKRLNGYVQDQFVLDCLCRHRARDCESRRQGDPEKFPELGHGVFLSERTASRLRGTTGLHIEAAYSPAFNLVR